MLERAVGWRKRITLFSEACFSGLVGLVDSNSSQHASGIAFARSNVFDPI